MSDGIIETIVENAIEIGVPNLIDEAAGDSLNDATRASIGEAVAEAMSEAAEAAIEKLGDLYANPTTEKFDDVLEGFGEFLDVFSTATEVVNVLQRDDLTPEQKSALSAITLIDKLAYLSGDGTALAEAAINIRNHLDAELERLFAENPDIFLPRANPGDRPTPKPAPDPTTPPEPQETPTPIVPAELNPPASPAFANAPNQTFGQAPTNTCPLILDLNGDGIAVTSLGGSASTGSSVYFDLDTDGFAERTSWVLPTGMTNSTGTGGDDAFLVRDLNANGVIDNELEMFCVTTDFTNGFINLATLDQNGDGTLDGSDAEFASLNLWIDANGDGVTDDGELHSLADYGVASFDLNYTDVEDTLILDNLITANSTFSFDDGRQGTITDLWFRNDDFDTRYLGDVTLDVRVLFLPSLRGVGDLTHLHVAMSADEVLLQLVSDFRLGWDAAKLSDPAALDAEVEAILFRWAGIDTVVEGTRGPHVRAQALEFMEMFSGNAFGVIAGSPIRDPEGYWHADAVEAAYEQAFLALKAQLLFQVGAQDVFGEINGIYDPVAGTMNETVTLQQAGVDLIAAQAAASPDLYAFWFNVARLLVQVKPLESYSTAEHNMLQQAVSGSGAGWSWTSLIQSAQNELSSVAVTGGEGSDHFVGGNGSDTLNGAGGADLLEGLAGNDGLHGGNGNDIAYGGAGDDDIHGNAGDDEVHGGTGTNRLYGGYGDDTYYLNGTEDLLQDDGGDGDLVVLEDAQLLLAELGLVRSGYLGWDLAVQFNGITAFTVMGHFYSIGGIETLRFADGQEVSLATYNNVVGTQNDDQLVGGDAGLLPDDYVFGYGGADELTGGIGNNYLEGGSGNDIYHYAGGFDHVHDQGYASDGDEIRFASGIDWSGLSLQRTGDLDLMITLGGQNIVLIEGQFAQSDAIETLRFADGTTVDLYDIIYTTSGTTGADYLQGTGYGAKADVLLGLDGDDHLVAFDGNDTLDGGPGADLAYGGWGDDRYLIGDFGNSVYDDAGTDRIVFDATFDVGDLNLVKSHASLDVQFAGVSAVVVQNQFSAGSHVEFLEFADGTIIDLLAMAYPQTGDAERNYISGISFGGDPNDLLRGLGGDDRITGGMGNDTLDGGPGDNFLDGGAGDDLYLISAGQNTVTDAGGLDTIEMDVGFDLDDLSFALSGYNNRSLALFFSDGSSVLLQNQFYSTGYGIEEVRFADGRKFDVTALHFDLVGTDQSDNLNGLSRASDRIFGLAGDDYLYGNSGDDTLSGGTGSDYAYGGQGDDLYHWDIGDGDDTLNEASGADTLEFGAGIAAVDVQYFVSGWDLQIKVGSETLVLQNQFYSYGSVTYSSYQIETLRFADGTERSLTSGLTLTGSGSADSLVGLNSSNDSLLGLGGNDYLYGYDGSDTLNGGSGDDYGYGGSGDDIYEWSLGDGNDTLSEESGDDVLKLGSGILQGDIRFFISGRDLQVHVGAETITLLNQFYTYGSTHYTTYQIEKLRFDDGTELSLTSDLTLTGSALSDSLNGLTMGADSLLGLAGDDYLYGYDGADTLNGGTDDDNGYGGSGDDTYEWSLGDGNDTLGEESGSDVLSLGSGVTLADVRFFLSGRDLQVHIGAEYITLQNQFYSYGGTLYTTYQFETLRFDDGTELSLTADLSFVGGTLADSLQGLDNSSDSLSGVGGDDYLYGYGGSDTLNGGAGSDYVYGGADDDTYEWSLGDGNDTLGEESGADRLEFGPGIAHADVRFAVSGRDLQVHVGSEVITLQNQFYSYGGVVYTTYQIETLLFEDGTTLDLTKDLAFGGTPGDDYIYGRDDDNVVTGGPGSDYLYGYAGNDSYLWQAGDGNDTIGESDGVDVLVLGPGIAPEDVRLELSGRDLWVYVGSEKITLQNQFYTYGGTVYTSYQVETLQFDDGTIIDLTANLTFEGSSIDDYIYGRDDDNTLIGAAGNDYLYGYQGDDHYLWNLGHGNDIISESDGADVLQLGQGISASDLRFALSGRDLHIHIGSEKITLQNQFYTYGGTVYTTYQVETLRFSDGSALDLTANLTFAGTSADEYLYGRDDDNMLVGGAGDDVIYAYGGVDTAFFAGLYSDYAVQDLGSYLWVVDQAGTDGSDILYDVEYLAFADGTVTVATGNFAPLLTPGLVQVFASRGDDADNGSSLGEYVDLLGGHDAFNALGGDDKVLGGAGDDTIDGGGGKDTLIGGPGDDSLNGGSGSDSIDGGDGDDTLDGSFGADQALIGGFGDDLILGGGGADLLNGGGDNDTLHGDANPDTLLGGSGHDRLYGQIGSDSLLGGEGDDYLSGANAADTLFGGAGNDTLLGQGESDSVHGEAGDDTLLGGASADRLWGDEGDDSLDGGAFNDSLLGGAGNDTLIGGSGLDTADGGDGNDVIDGGSSRDTLLGGNGDDTIFGGIGNDSLLGGADADSLLGGAANDTLDGGGGSDVVFGGSGSDLIFVRAGEGGDTLFGEGGLDVFDFEGGFGSATIGDFTGQDKIDLANVASVAAFGDLFITYGAEAVIDLGGGDTLILTGITSGLTAADFEFM